MLKKMEPVPAFCRLMVREKSDLGQPEPVFCIDEKAEVSAFLHCALEWGLDMENLEQLMRKYGNDVLRLAYLYVKDMHTAEDMFQEVFIKVHEKLHTFEGKSDIKTWILRITINTCKDYLKSAYHSRVVPMYDFAGERLTGEDGEAGERLRLEAGEEYATGQEFTRLEREETAQTVREAVGMLPEKYRELVVCVYFQEMSLEAAARMLGISSGTAKSRISRARERLKELLGREVIG